MQWRRRRRAATGPDRRCAAAWAPATRPGPAPAARPRGPRPARARAAGRRARAGAPPSHGPMSWWSWLPGTMTTSRSGPSARPSSSNSARAAASGSCAGPSRSSSTSPSSTSRSTSVERREQRLAHRRPGAAGRCLDRAPRWRSERTSCFTRRARVLPPARRRTARAGPSCRTCRPRSSGTSSMNSTRSGSHHLATRPARNSRSAVGVELGAALEHDARARPLAPLLVGHGDDRRLEHVGVGHDLVLELDRRDPLAARLHEVLGAVDELDVGAVAQLGDVAGAQPAVLGELLARCRRRSSRAR